MFNCYQIIYPCVFSDGPFLQKLAKFETCNAPSDGTTTRNTYSLTIGNGSIDNDRSKLVDLLCNKIQVRFQDTKDGLISATSVANFNLWPDDESRLEG